jgi:5'(3')-deoxyribonucleotidase
MKLHLLLDIDGVQRNLVSTILKIYQREYDPESTVRFEDIKDFNLNLFLPKLPGDVRDVMFKKHAEEVFAYAQPFEESVADVVKQLQEKYFVHMVTHQFPGNESYAFQWLTTYGVPYDAISFVGDKRLIKGSLLIDDGPHNLDALLSDNREVVCIERPWNASWRENNPDQPSYTKLSDFLYKYDHEALYERTQKLLSSSSEHIINSLPSSSVPFVDKKEPSYQNGGLKKASPYVHVGPKKVPKPSQKKLRK